MQYKNGREAKFGDQVVYVNPLGVPSAGTLLTAYDSKATPDSVRIMPDVLMYTLPQVNVGDCLHAEDVAAAIKTAKL